MTAPSPAAVAVPVELLAELIALVTFHKGATPAGRAVLALLPKQSARLVAVDLNCVPKDLTNEWVAVGFLAALPDLMEIIENAVRDNGRHLGNSRVYADEVLMRIRAALGVTG